MPTHPQLKRLFALARKAGLSPDDVKAVVADRYGHRSRRGLSDREYEELCRHLQDCAAGAAASSGRLKAGELANLLEITAWLNAEGLPWDRLIVTETDLVQAAQILEDFRRYRSYGRISIAQARKWLAWWGRRPISIWRRAAMIWLEHYRRLNERYFAGILRHVEADARRAA